MRAALLALAIVLPLHAELTIATVSQGGEESPLSGNLLELPPADPGDAVDTRIRLRNTGTTPLSLTTLRLAGEGFSLHGHPTLPVSVAPTTNVDFRIRFQPAAPGFFSAGLQINEKALLIRAQGREGITVVLASTGEVVSNLSPIDFGRVEIGSAATRRLLLRNHGGRAVGLTRKAVTGAGFTVQEPAAAALLEPGSEQAIEVELRPLRAGVTQGTLEINARRFALTGAAVLPVLPGIVLDTGGAPVESGRQVPLILRLDGAAPVDLAGTVTLRFEPATGLPDDLAVQLLPGGGRSARVSIAAGRSPAVWGNTDLAVLQTGTTAGVIRLTARIADNEQEWSYPIPRTLIRLDTVQAARTPNGIEVTVSGFDNTRTISEGVFRFFDASGAALEPARVFLRDLFGRYFAGSGAGGLFRLQLRFPVTGDASFITALDVELVNDQGTTRPERIRF